MHAATESPAAFVGWLKLPEGWVRTLETGDHSAGLRDLIDAWWAADALQAALLPEGMHPEDLGDDQCN